MAINKILIIIQRSNGDVFLSTPLIKQLQSFYPNAKIDLLVNQDTLAISRTLPFVYTILTYDYAWRKENRFKRISKELNLVKSIFRKYDLAINLTASDRSVLYAIFAGSTSVSAVESDSKKSWWKRLLLTRSFSVDVNRHILQHNVMPLTLLGIESRHIRMQAYYDQKALNELKMIPFDIKKPFIIFHPSAQYNYKIYPKHLRNQLLKRLSELDIPIAVTGGNNEPDRSIAGELPDIANLFNLIGKTSLSGFIALCDHAIAYIGMDTLNMHIAAALNKRVFAIFGPTFPQIWSPWCNKLQCAATSNSPIQTYDNITLFQADMPCVACGKAGCDDHSGKSDCLEQIAPEIIFSEVSQWLNKLV